MTSFEERGVERQYDARNISAANRSFKRSCDICCNAGFHIECDRCAIAVANKAVTEYYECHRTAEVEDFWKYRRLEFA